VRAMSHQNARSQQNARTQNNVMPIHPKWGVGQFQMPPEDWTAAAKDALDEVKTVVSSQWLAHPDTLTLPSRQRSGCFYSHSGGCPNGLVVRGDGDDTRIGGNS